MFTVVSCERAVDGAVSVPADNVAIDGPAVQRAAKETNTALHVAVAIFNFIFNFCLLIVILFI